MLSGRKFITIILSIIIITGQPLIADWKEDAKAIDISGGEHHTLVLTKNKWPWACGNNYSYQLGIGDDTTDQKILVRVHGPNDVNFLDDIDDVDAGWSHSLALDVNGLVWAWGWNEQGQLGDPQLDYTTTPVQVHGVDDVGFLQYIVAISAGRSGEYSMAMDPNFVYAWGRNEEGQLGKIYFAFGLFWCYNT